VIRCTLNQSNYIIDFLAGNKYFRSTPFLPA